MTNSEKSCDLVNWNPVIFGAVSQLFTKYETVDFFGGKGAD